MRNTLIEDWIELDEFPDYSISSFGRVVHNYTDRLKKPSLNQQGIAMVNFSVRGVQNVRSIALLVAHTFLSREDVPDHYDTPIHLDGDRRNCRVDNLRWRPRWYAVMYHKQFSLNHFGESRFRIPIQLMETGEVFENTWDAAIAHGMLERDIAVNTANGDPVPLQGYTFEFLE